MVNEIVNQLKYFGITLQNNLKLCPQLFPKPNFRIFEKMAPQKIRELASFQLGRHGSFKIFIYSYIRSYIH